MKTFACLIQGPIRNVTRITCSAIHLEFIVPHCFFQVYGTVFSCHESIGSHRCLGCFAHSSGSNICLTLLLILCLKVFSERFRISGNTYKKISFSILLNQLFYLPIGTSHPSLPANKKIAVYFKNCIM